MAEVVETGTDLSVSGDVQQRRRNIMEKRTGQELRDKWAQQDAADYREKIKAISPERVVEPRCHVCTSEHRDFIEHFVGQGYGYTHISEHVPPDKDGRTIDPRSIKKHTEKHMEIEKQRIRAELDESAEEIQQNVDGKRGPLTERGMMKVLIREAFEKALRGEISMEIRDMIQATKLINDMEVKSSTDRAERYELEMQIFIRAVQKICDDDTLAAIMGEVRYLRSQDEIDIEMEKVLAAPPKQIEAIQGEVIDE